MKKVKNLLSVFIFSCALFADEICHVSVPSFLNEDILLYNVGIRPYRKSGVRLEPEWFNKKLIIHNYGHGGAGLTLSWGSAHEVWAILKNEILLKDELTPEKTVAILGGGIIGLCVADVLLDHGYAVKLYAEKFHPHTTSDVAAGFFGLFSIDVPEDQNKKEQFDRIFQQSQIKLHELSESENPAFNGVELIDFYIFNTQKNENEKKYRVVFSNGIEKNCIKKRKIIMKGSTYLKDLFEKIQSKGAQIIKRAFIDIDDILSLPESIIINCTGFGSRYLFNDYNLIGIRGHTIHIKKIADFNYLIGNDDQDSFFIMPWDDRLVLGSRLTLEYNKIVPELNAGICDLIMKKTQSFFKGHL